MNRQLPREWAKYEYKDAEKILIGLRTLEKQLQLKSLEYKIKSLRTRELRPFLEGRQAALFCYGMGQILDTKISFAQVEREDYDIIARYELNDELIYTPVQLKEWVPNRIQELSDLQTELDKLKKYADAKDLTVAFFLNRSERIELSKLQFPSSTIGELWFFGAATPDQKIWQIMGNLISPNPLSHEFEYPT